MANDKNSTDMAILCLLTLKPMSGYEIWNQISSRLGLVWYESFSQIYPSLDRLQKDGLVGRIHEMEPVGTEGSKSKKVYGITDAGREKVTKWLRVPYKVRHLKSELLLKFSFGFNAEPGAIAHHLNVFRATQEGLMETFEEQEKQIRQEYANHKLLPYWLAMVKFGKMQSATYLEWIKETSAMIAKLDAQSEEAAIEPEKAPKKYKYATY